MASSYPGALDAFTNPDAADQLDSVTVPHATQHADVNDGLEAVQAELGVNPAGTEATVADRLLTIEAGLPAAPVIVEVEYTDDHTLVLTDASRLLRMNKASAVSLTVPANADVAFPVGTTILVYQAGAGTVTVEPDTGSTLSIGSAVDLAGQYAVASLIKRDTDVWLLSGGLA